MSSIVGPVQSASRSIDLLPAPPGAKTLPDFVCAVLNVDEDELLNADEAADDEDAELELVVLEVVRATTGVLVVEVVDELEVVEGDAETIVIAI